MATQTTFARIAAVVNKAITPLVTGGPLKGALTMVTYTGRRSGSTFSTPVACSVKGDHATIRVALPDQKQWWRNFTGDGHDLTLTIKGVERSGHGVATRDDKGRVTVAVTLAP